MASMESLWAPPPGRTPALTKEDFDDFKRLYETELDPALFPLADDIQQRIPLYSSAKLRGLVRGTAEERTSVLDEIHRALSIGPGVLVLRGLQAKSLIDRVVEASAVIEKKDPSPPTGGSKRLFAFSEKLAKHDPELYAEYYGNDLLAAACEAWLGVGYQITTTLNAVYAGNTQGIHRDYPLSGLPPDRIARFPLINQMASQLLTMQGAIAHTDMPLECGPTRFAVFTQQFQKGYTAFKRPEYTDWISTRMSQLPLERGDAVIFNPACLHQPGENTSSGARTANLFQVSACWGTPMETTDKLAIAESVWPVVKKWAAEVGKTRHALELEALITASCDDFGHSKDFDNMPAHQPTQAGLLKEALSEGWSDQQVHDALWQHASWHRPWK